MTHKGELCEAFGKWKVLSFTSFLALELGSGIRLDAQTADTVSWAANFAKSVKSCRLLLQQLPDATQQKVRPFVSAIAALERRWRRH